MPDSANEKHKYLIKAPGPEGGNYFDSAYMDEIIAHQQQLMGVYDKAIKTSADAIMDYDG